MSKPFVRPDVQMILDLMAAQEGPDIADVDAPTARELYNAMATMFEVEAPELAVKRDLSIPGPAGDIPARLYDPRESREAGPMMVFYHGGGFVIGNLETHDAFCAHVSKELDLPVVAIDYRLAPEHPFPAAPDDCLAATRWIANSPAELGREVTGLIPFGDSAGGNLTLVISLALRDGPAAVPVIVQWPIYPASDLGFEGGSMEEFAEGFLLEAKTMEYFVDAYKADPESPLANPAVKDEAGLPPTLLITAGLDPLRDQGREYAGKLIAAGVETSYREARGNVHGFINIRKAVPSSQQDVDGCLVVLKEMIAEATAV